MRRTLSGQMRRIHQVGGSVYVDVQGFIFVPGWTFLGATYDVLIVQPFVAVAISDPAPLNINGVFNTYIVPIELSWTKIGGSNFAVKTGLGMYVPDGHHTGPSWYWQCRQPCLDVPA